MSADNRFNKEKDPSGDRQLVQFFVILVGLTALLLFLLKALIVTPASFGTAGDWIDMATKATK